MSVLILADERDTSADRMVVALEERGAEVHRIDTGWFPAQLSISAQLRGDCWAGHLETPHRTVELEEIHSVWYRSPRAYQFSAALNAAEAEHAKVEARYGLGGVLMSLPVLWVNHPSRLAESAYKPYQLAVAARCGLAVANTLITNSTSAVREFASQQATVTKMLGAISIIEEGQRLFAHTQRVDADDLADLRGVEMTTHQFQHWASKAYEARMFVVGRQITTAAIHAHTDAAYVDWRHGYGTNSYDLITAPTPVIDGVLRLMGELHLAFGALDFVVGPDGTWTFLEINAGGQYGWIEDATGAPITDQLADLLAKGVL
ncbi:ATP-grasp ribosomal peptide maturase [Amycolatopsis sp. GM8]|uniref:ATP-grasp ribosomal peptide maturase n=1 Tax=Amycolatopsis sp. GM8 TaxID=2896530 RepID=UPI001F0309C2|nr:ATP-grasp ribosomal peptide maturase [Amycolatopsis sp. GM8]